MAANHPSENDPAVQTRSVDQRFEYVLAEQVFQIEARYIHAAAVEHTIADVKILPHQVPERHAASRQVAPVLVWRQGNATVARDGFQHFDVNQRYLTINVRSRRVRPKPCRVAVAVNTDAW